MRNILRVAFCGAHGTGKTTQIQLLSSFSEISILTGTVREYWAKAGIDNFELLSPLERTKHQWLLLLNQVDLEDKYYQTGFITERSSLDYLAYTCYSSQMEDHILQGFTKLVQERMSKYSHIVYFPIEFEVNNEKMRADVTSRKEIDNIIKSYLSLWKKPEEFMTVSGSVETRHKQITEYLKV